ncbi:MAG TPA: cupin domain-containing protein [Puia sp.]|nr:cupin domain-containing protein [Puia sp.]
MKENAAYWIKKLELTKHVEGGYFKENYRSDLLIAKEHLPESFHGNRPASTSIYFLLEKEQFSALHRIASDEIWHFYVGDCITIYEFKEDGHLTEHHLGNDPEKNESFQVLINAGSWFGAKLKNGGEYALVGCTVAPGFDFAEFEMAERSFLLQLYPAHTNLIMSLTRW